jgi:hypothetical protein
LTQETVVSHEVIKGSPQVVTAVQQILTEAARTLGEVILGVEGGGRVEHFFKIYY